MTAENIEPHSSIGRVLILASPKVEEIEAFIYSSSQNRQMSYFQLTHDVFHFIGDCEVIQRELEVRRFVCWIARSKPRRPPGVKQARYNFARDHLNW